MRHIYLFFILILLHSTSALSNTELSTTDNLYISASSIKYPNKKCSTTINFNGIYLQSVHYILIDKKIVYDSSEITQNEPIDFKSELSTITVQNCPVSNKDFVKIVLNNGLLLEQYINVIPYSGKLQPKVGTGAALKAAMKTVANVLRAGNMILPAFHRQVAKRQV